MYAYLVVIYDDSTALKKLFAIQAQIFEVATSISVLELVTPSVYIVGTCFILEKSIDLNPPLM